MSAKEITLLLYKLIPNFGGLIADETGTFIIINETDHMDSEEKMRIPYPDWLAKPDWRLP